MVRPVQDLAEPAPRLRSPIRGDIAGAGIATVLLATAFLVPRIASEQWRSKLYAGAAPIFGNWLPHAGWGTVPAVVVAALVITWGPALAERLPWRRLLATAWGVAVAWAFSLAMVDGWQRGFAGRLTDSNEYLHEVGGVTDIPGMLREFSGRILDFQPDSWTTHVAGHPPGALLFFVLLDRLGLGGGAWAGLACMVIGCSVAVAVAVALRALGAEDRARAALPFLVLAPAALWIAVSADAIFAGVTAWAVALLAIAVRPGGSPVAGVSAGVLFGFGIHLSYGLVLMAIPAVAVFLSSRTARPLLPAAAGALAVAAAFTLAGFWWLDGYHLVVERYYQGIAAERSYAYWWWGNLAATVCAVGLATCAAAHRAVAWTRLRALEPTSLLVAAGLCAILVADISGLSKAETERIWLPFDLWLLVATAFLPRSSARAWLAVQALGAMLVVHLILTNW
ncbi:hypothetical protein OHA40_07360 [Nocardia sp. NBC_00508]|uniref:hypothetical protein n=1 Tax=Nocardia sp. NBC_00508 TaxID=2975992 RepID=UPI002E812965|nr:hypothetical protein [Nocardia sp. NBC_00508]WUD67935.1 hypothetical protein OHA40_07360 [Nocardia sp. NBC_00508]